MMENEMKNSYYKRVIKWKYPDGTYYKWFHRGLVLEEKCIGTDREFFKVLWSSKDAMDLNVPGKSNGWYPREHFIDSTERYTK